MQADKSLNLLLLGDCVARTADGCELKIASRKGRALLAALALARDMRLGREQLASLLWGDRVDAQARQSLRQCLIGLRKELGAASAALVATTEAIALDRDAVWIDAVEFGRAAGAGDGAAADRALALYGGPFLKDFNVEADGFATWVEGERARLERLAATLLQRRAEHRDAAGAGADAITDAERLVALDPLREDWRRLVLRLYARHNGREHAIKHAERFAAHLREELGAQPEPATRALIEQILRDELAPAVLAPAAAADLAPSAAAARDSAPAAAAVASPAVAARPVTAWVLAGRGRSALALASLAAVLVLGAIVGFAWLHLPRAALGAPASATISLRVLPASIPAAQNGVRDVAEAFTADLADRLSRFGDLRVIAASDAGQGTSYTIGSDARLDANVGRMSVRLIDNGDGHQVQIDQVELPPPGRDRDVILGRIARQLDNELNILEARKLPVGADLTEAQLIIKGRAARARGAGRQNFEEMRAAYEAALIKNPNSVPALVGMVSVIVSRWTASLSDSRPNFDRAVQLLDRAVQIEPDSVLVQYWLGVVYKGSNKFDLALRCFERAAELNPSYPGAYAQMGSTLALLGRPEEAVDKIEFAMQMSPDDPAYSVWAVFETRALLHLGREAQALDVLERGERVNPADPNLHAFLAAVNMLLGNRKAAAEHAARYRALAAPGAIDVIVKIGHNPAMERAQKAFEEALKIGS